LRSIDDFWRSSVARLSGSYTTARAQERRRGAAELHFELVLKGLFGARPDAKTVVLHLDEEGHRRACPGGGAVDSGLDA
jgi:hypothetical protein